MKYDVQFTSQFKKDLKLAKKQKKNSAWFPLRIIQKIRKAASYD